MNHLFGKKKEPAPKPGVTEAATKMKAHLATMEKREKFIEQKIAKEIANAKQRSRAKDKRGALMALKRKKMHEGEINQLQQVRFGIEQQIMVLEQANVSKDTVAAMKTGRDALKQAQADLAIDDVEDVMDDVRDGMEEMSEVNEVLAQGFGDQMDESELLDEFEQLEEELLDEQLMDISAPAWSTSAGCSGSCRACSCC